MDNRGVSAVLGYVLTLGIVTLLIGGLFLAAGGFVEDEHERVVRSEFEVIGNRVAADLAAIDRLALAAGSTGEAELVTDLPSLAAGSTYHISLEAVTGTDNDYFVNLTANDPQVTVSTRVKIETPVVESTVGGGDVLVVYNGTHVEVRNG